MTYVGVGFLGRCLVMFGLLRRCLAMFGLDDPRIGFQFRTGLDASLPCVCRPRNPPRAAVNCDDTPLQ